MLIHTEAIDVQDLTENCPSHCRANIANSLTKVVTHRILRNPKRIDARISISIDFKLFS